MLKKLYEEYKLFNLIRIFNQTAKISGEAFPLFGHVTIFDVHFAFITRQISNLKSFYKYSWEHLNIKH